MEDKSKELYKNVLEHVLEDYSEILKDESCLKLFTEGYKSGYKDGYKAAMEDIKMKMCQAPMFPMGSMKKPDDDGAQPFWPSFW